MQNEKSISHVSLGKDEMNLVEFPITLLSKRQHNKEKSIEFCDTIIGHDKKTIKRKWVVTGSEKFGLPLAYDNDVLLAILQIGKENNFSSPIINFSRYKLMKVMGWRNDGRSYKRIKDSLRRLKGVNIEAENAFWDNDQKCYITLGFGIINEYAIFDSSVKKGDYHQETFDFSYVELNQRIFNSIKSGYIKNLDMKLYFGLKSVITKRLYRYLDKKRYTKNKFEIGLFTLAYSHLGLNSESYKYPSDIKRKLNKAHKELEDIGYLKSVKYLPTADGQSIKVVYYFAHKHKDELVDEKDKQKKIEDSLDKNLIEKLLKIGVTHGVAIQLLRDYPAQAIQEQIDALPYRGANEPAAFLVRSVQENWAPPAEYLKQQEEEELGRQKKDRQIQEEKIKSQRREKVQNYLNSLSRTELAELNREAKEKAYKEGGNFFRGKELLPVIVKSYLYTIAEKKLGL